MVNTDITRTEMVWPGKFNQDGTRRPVPQVNLPFQVIETVNESRVTRESRKGGLQTTLFKTYDGLEGSTFEDGWRNKLIWGDNLLVMNSLTQRFAGKIDLIYIDPPFATGADFSFTTAIGDSGEEVFKQQSVIEEKAYRDTWGRDLDSYLSMIYDRLRLMHQLLSETGSIYVHLGWQVASYVKPLLDEIFGKENFQNEIIWKRQTAKGGAFDTLDRYGRIHETIFFYTRSENYKWNLQYTPYDESHVKKSYKHSDSSGRKYALRDLTAAGTRKGDSGKPITISGHTIDLPKGRHWAVGLKKGETVQEGVNRLIETDKMWFEPGKMPRLKLYLDEMPGVPLQSMWTDVLPVQAQSNERLDYSTQKPEALLKRIIESSSDPGDLIADFFCGSGTTIATAEKLGRRWIASDLGRFAIHTCRKRLLDIKECKPFEILNLGKYEQQYWQNVTFGDTTDGVSEKTLYDYLDFMLRLHSAVPISGLTYLHGKKGRAMVHIGAVDAPVTFNEVSAAIEECTRVKQKELHILGWEWEMGLYDVVDEVSKAKGVKLTLLQIPREVMEQQSLKPGDVHFFELAYLDAKVTMPKKMSAQVSLKDFVIPNTELIPDDVRGKVKKWSDYIDYWAIDWDFQNDTFMQGWVAYRTRMKRTLLLESDIHKYDKPGTHRILVKVIDIFGNDTSQIFTIEAS